MIDLTKVNGIIKATQELADLQRQVNSSQGAGAAKQAGKAQGTQQADPATSQMFAQLGNLISTAATQAPAQQNALQKSASLLSAKVKTLMSKADALESELNLSPDNDPVQAEELFAQFIEIMEGFEKDMRAIEKHLQEKKDGNKMDVTQKPTALKPGENAADLSFNTSLTLQ